jgi:hypothetical protein
MPFKDFLQFCDQANAKALKADILWDALKVRSYTEIAAQYGLPVQEVYRIMRDHNRLSQADHRRADLDRAVTSLLANPHSDQFLQAYLHALLVREAQALEATDVLRKLAPLGADPQPSPVLSACAAHKPQTSTFPARFPSPSAVLPGLTAAWGFLSRKYHSWVNGKSHV